MKWVRGYLADHLEAKILAIILTFLVCGFAILYLLLSNRMEKDAVTQTREKSELLASSVHRTIDRSMVNFRADIVRHFTQDLKEMPGMIRFQIVRGKTGNGTEEAFQDMTTLEDVKTRVPGGLRPEWLAGHPEKARNVAEGSDASEFRAAFENYLQNPTDPDTYYFEKISDKKVMTYLKPLPNLDRCFLCHGSDHKLRGVLMISTSMEEMETNLHDQKRDLFFISLGTLLATGILLKISVGRWAMKPLVQLSDRIQDIAGGEGDLSKRLEVRSSDEIGKLAGGFNLFAEKLSRLISQILTAAKKVSSTANGLMEGNQEIMKGAEIQTNAIEATSVSIDQINLGIRSVAETSGSLAATAKESAEAIQQMAVAMDEIARNMTVLNASVEETSSSILQTSAAVKKIDENVETLLGEAETTSSSMIEMDQSLKGMRDTILQTVDFSREVSTNADTGKRTVEQTMEGMTRIKEYSMEVFQVIRNLQRQTEDIGGILNVIDDVAEQTNLLALNAAIIAAQAGEHGKGFSVVANEIKELAERTAGSTHQIHEIIKALQTEGKKAVAAIEVGNTRVEEGVLLSKSAQEALGRIVESIDHSSRRVTLVGTTMEEQSKAVHQVMTSMERVTQIVRQIAGSTGEQSQGSEKIIEATHLMKSITHGLQSAVMAHSKGIKKVTETVDAVSRLAQEIAGATSDQKIQSEEIMQAIEQIKKVTQENIDTVGKVGFGVEELIEQSKQLEEEISRFKL
ncbi:MAG: methyl-accepting chemotaxis protein [Candidatus Manganitrophaceae bacterium]